MSGRGNAGSTAALAPFPPIARRNYCAMPAATVAEPVTSGRRTCLEPDLFGAES